LGRSGADKRTGQATLAGVAALIVCLLLVATAGADTFKPTRKDDPVPNGCRPHDCSLREASIAANANPGADLIPLKRGTYEIQLGFGDAPSFQSDGLDLFSAVEIRGAGPTKTRIDANGIDRPVEIGIGISAGHMNVTLRALTLRGGDAGAPTAGNSGSQGGGVISARGNLTLKHVVIRNNEAQFGGGIESFADGALRIKKSTIAGNNAGEGGAIDLGAGLDPGELVPVKISASTISGNFAGKGAGILADGNPEPGDPPRVKMVNSTVAGNMASAEAGGIMADNGATVTLDHTTVVDNMADSDNVGGGDAGTGQAVAVEGQGGTVCTFNVSPFAIIDPADRRLGLLDDNGGPTKTVKLLAGSLAIGFANSCPKGDQRGVPRPHQDCDSGAFERKKP
jgi:hypothetical protein